MRLYIVILFLPLFLSSQPIVIKDSDSTTNRSPGVVFTPMKGAGVYYMWKPEKIWRRVSLVLEGDLKDSAGNKPVMLTDSLMHFREFHSRSGLYDLRFAFIREKSIFTRGVEFSLGYSQEDYWYGQYYLTYRRDTSSAKVFYYDNAGHWLEDPEEAYRNYTLAGARRQQYLRIGLAPLLGFSYRGQAFHFALIMQPGFGYYISLRDRKEDPLSIYKPGRNTLEFEPAMQVVFGVCVSKK